VQSVGFVCAANGGLQNVSRIGLVLYQLDVLNADGIGTEVWLKLSAAQMELPWYVRFCE
jgi:hypothetical protein